MSLAEAIRNLNADSYVLVVVDFAVKASSGMEKVVSYAQSIDIVAILLGSTNS